MAQTEGQWLGTHRKPCWHLGQIAASMAKRWPWRRWVKDGPAGVTQAPSL